MKRSFAGALNFTKLSVCLACTWPPSLYATKWDTIKYDVAWSLSFLSSLCLLIPLLLAASKYREDSLLLTQSVCFGGATANLLAKMIIQRILKKRTQIINHEMEEFLANATDNEREILQRYLDRCSIFHVFITIVNYLTTIGFIIGSFFIPDKLLVESTVYPFSIETNLARQLVSAHQGFAGLQNSAGVTIDCQVAMTMWYASARLEILAGELKNIRDSREFGTFVMKHREILSCAYDVSSTMSYVALVSSTVCGIAAIMSSLQLFGDQALFVKLQFVPVAVIATVNLFICAWPADHMINTCDFLGIAVYDSNWIKMPRNMMTNIPMLLARCQRPVTVSVPGLLPTLSLNSYASFLSAIFSYITTLRVVVMSNEEK